MAVAGIAWGVYTIRGKGESNAAIATTKSFVFATILVSWLLPHRILFGFATPVGLAYACASGAITSGLGYIAWYAALPGLTAPKAAVVQLCVPILAGLAGALIAQEPVSQRLCVSGAVVLGGVALAVLTRAKPPIRSGPTGSSEDS